MGLYHFRSLPKAPVSRLRSSRVHPTTLASSRPQRWPPSAEAPQRFSDWTFSSLDSAGACVFPPPGRLLSSASSQRAPPDPPMLLSSQEPLPLALRCWNPGRRHILPAPGVRPPRGTWAVGTCDPRGPFPRWERSRGLHSNKRQSPDFFRKCLRALLSWSTFFGLF